MKPLAFIFEQPSYPMSWGKEIKCEFCQVFMNMHHLINALIQGNECLIFFQL